MSYHFVSLFFIRFVFVFVFVLARFDCIGICSKSAVPDESEGFIRISEVMLTFQITLLLLPCMSQSLCMLLTTSILTRTI